MSASPLECPICYQHYTLGVYPVAGRCGHSICSNCIDQLTNSKCPICRGQQSFRSPVRNFLGHELVKYVIMKSGPEGATAVQKHLQLARRMREVQDQIIRLEQHLSYSNQSSPESDVESRRPRRAENPRFFQRHLIRRDRSPQETPAPPPAEPMYPFHHMNSAMIHVPIAPVLPAYPFPVMSYPLQVMFPFHIPF